MEVAQRSISLLKLLIEEHKELYKDLEVDGHQIQRDEQMFLWMYLIKFAAKNYGHGMFIRKEEGSLKLDKDLVSCLTELSERGYIDAELDKAMKSLFDTPIPTLRQQIKDEDEEAYKYLMGKASLYDRK